MENEKVTFHGYNKDFNIHGFTIIPHMTSFYPPIGNRSCTKHLFVRQSFLKALHSFVRQIDCVDFLPTYQAGHGFSARSCDRAVSQTQ
jgi:hypothetical protein